MAPYPIELTLENSKHLATMHPQFVSEFELLQPWPRKESSLNTPIRPFQFLVFFFFIF